MKIRDIVFSIPPGSDQFVIIQDGCYQFESGGGCNDPEACNYNDEVLFNDGSCLYDDCAGDCNGDAFEDECGNCCGGNTGIECSYWNSQWDFGGEYDCAGDCFGSAIENECGCVGGSTGLEVDYCFGCTDPGALNYDPDFTIDDGSCVFE